MSQKVVLKMGEKSVKINNADTLSKKFRQHNFRAFWDSKLIQYWVLTRSCFQNLLYL